MTHIGPKLSCGVVWCYAILTCCTCQTLPMYCMCHKCVVACPCQTRPKGLHVLSASPGMKPSYFLLKSSETTLIATELLQLTSSDGLSSTYSCLSEKADPLPCFLARVNCYITCGTYNRHTWKNLACVASDCATYRHGNSWYYV